MSKPDEYDGSGFGIFFFVLAVLAISATTNACLGYEFAQQNARNDTCHAVCSINKRGKGVWVESFDRCVCEADHCAETVRKLKKLPTFDMVTGYGGGSMEKRPDEFGAWYSADDIQELLGWDPTEPDEEAGTL